MATGGQEKAGYSLVNVGYLTLENTIDLPWYQGIVACRDKIIVIDRDECQVRLHRRQDGKLLCTHRLESWPRAICVINDMEIAVILDDGQIQIMAVESREKMATITSTMNLQVQGGFDIYDGVVKFKENLVVCGVKQETISWCLVSLNDGRVDTINQICKVYYNKKCTTSSVYNSHLTTKDNIIYISCRASFKSPDNGVYGFDILNPSQPKYTYKHEHLSVPGPIAINQYGFIFVCNIDSCIHQLTSQCQLVSIYRQGIPWTFTAMFCDHPHGHLYVTRLMSNVITVFQPEFPGIPIEILNMDDRSIQLFEEALRAGKENMYSIRVMVVGHLGVGKTTMIKRLLGEEVGLSERHSTEGIDVYVNCCDVSISTHKWTRRKKDAEQDYQLQRLATVLNEQQSMRDKVTNEAQSEILPHGEKSDSNASVTDKEQVMIPPQGERTLNTNEGAHGAVKDKDAEILYCRSPQQEFDQNLSSTASQQEKSTTTIVQRKLQSETNTMAMLKFLRENATKLKPDTDKNSPLTMWDFAGQYAFYTTHQTFLTRRAIYLLVSDVSMQVTDLVADECYFDSEGIMKRKVHELIEVWLNSIHSCAPSPDAGIPPVILVGTHVDKISQKQSPSKGVESETQTTTSETVEFTQPTISTHAASATNKQPKTSTFLGSVRKLFKSRKTKRTVETTPVSSMTGAHAIPAIDQPKTQEMMKKERVDADKEKRFRHEICERYFKEVRSYLSDKPTRFHLIDEDFAIDNTIVDSSLEDLKRKIVKVASQQPYWGEEMPARWIPLEQELMRLRAGGIKVIPLSLLEDLNKAGAVQITTDELDLFLRFQHDIGTILYFSMEVLKEKIVLDPQWMIDALKSLITAEEFVLKSALAVADKWSEFKQKGKLSPELIDAIWTKGKNPDFHDNKEHILLLMEHLNIIAKPRCYTEDGSEIKVENYFLAPCMLQQTTPREVIFFEPQPNMESSSVLCYIFKGKYLPPPIFHRLLATCVAHWPIAQKMYENLIFCGCCVFSLDLHHRLTVFFKDYIIFALVTRMGTTEKTPSSKLCVEVREFITRTLSILIGYLGQSLQFELFIRCPKSDGYSVDSLIPVADLQENVDIPCHFHDNSHMIMSQDVLKFWFQDEQKMNSVAEISSGTSDLTAPKECQHSLRRRALPPGKKYHAFFSYSSSDIQWVKETVKRLEQDGFVCCEYERDNSPGTPLLTFAENSIKDAYKTVVVITREALESGFVNHEIDMAFVQGFDENRNCVVPVLLKVCEVPIRLRALNYVDAHDPSQRDIWWPKLLMELQTQGDDKIPETPESNEGKQPVSVETSAQLEQGDGKEDSIQQ